MRAHAHMNIAAATAIDRRDTYGLAPSNVPGLHGIPIMPTPAPPLSLSPSTMLNRAGTPRRWAVRPHTRHQGVPAACTHTSSSDELSESDQVAAARGRTCVSPHASLLLREEVAGATASWCAVDFTFGGDSTPRRRGPCATASSAASSTTSPLASHGERVRIRCGRTCEVYRQGCGRRQ